VKVTRTISIGNAAVLNEADYLEYLMDDPDTRSSSCTSRASVTAAASRACCAR
jgi:hypothetical protein